MKKHTRLLLSIVITAALTSGAHAQSDPFFKGKQIKIVVGFMQVESSIYGRGCSPNTWANTFPAIPT